MSFIVVLTDVRDQRVKVLARRDSLDEARLFLNTYSSDKTFKWEALEGGDLYKGFRQVEVLVPGKLWGNWGSKVDSIHESYLQIIVDENNYIPTSPIIAVVEQKVEEKAAPQPSSEEEKTDKIKRNLVKQGVKLGFEEVIAALKVEVIKAPHKRLMKPVFEDILRRRFKKQFSEVVKKIPLSVHYELPVFESVGQVVVLYKCLNCNFLRPESPVEGRCVVCQ